MTNAVVIVPRRAELAASRIRCRRCSRDSRITEVEAVDLAHLRVSPPGSTTSTSRHEIDTIPGQVRVEAR